MKHFMKDVMKINNLDSDYARVLNMLGLHIVLNKIGHNRYLTGF